MTVTENYELIKKRVAQACSRAGRDPEEIIVVGVTKTVQPGAIREAFHAGLRHFGENRVQEALDKAAALADIRSQYTFHMVGLIQSNKVSAAVKIFDYFQSVDSIKLAEFINQRAGRKVPVLLQVNITAETTKGGFSPGELPAVLKKIFLLPNIGIEGFMTIAPLTTDPELVRPVFKKLRELRNAFGLNQLSMGMTDDFEVAIEEGAT
ncbi:MAG: YggS family pyridoxal phosphate-dependent enzyme, partial [Dehalococcoidia bacterium]|nr:YggS family pyridoxal phosphate-dependent enzyme [Dehalococcoidia bacterium]